jgi:HEAT repeat protein
LLQRLVDENHEIRGEALVGLAKRRDERVLEPLIKELSSDSVGILAVEAAKEIGDARLSSVLRQLKRWNIDKNLLAEAINSCDK